MGLDQYLRTVERLTYDRMVGSGALPALAAALLSLSACDRAASGPAERDIESAIEGANIVPQGMRFTCTPTKVWDGDGPVWCAEGPRIRLSGIAAREMDGSCRSNQPCPDATAEAARDYLVGLLGSPAGTDASGHVLLSGAAPLSCESLGSGKGKRTAAWCRSPKSGDLSCRMVASGLAMRWGTYWKNHSCQG